LELALGYLARGQDRADVCPDGDAEPRVAVREAAGARVALGLQALGELSGSDQLASGASTLNAGRHARGAATVGLDQRALSRCARFGHRLGSAGAAPPLEPYSTTVTHRIPLRGASLSPGRYPSGQRLHNVARDGAPTPRIMIDGIVTNVQRRRCAWPLPR